MVAHAGSAEQSRPGESASVKPVVVRLFSPARRHWALLAVLAVYAGTAFIVPTLTPAWVADDWLYARSVRILLEDHQLRVMNLSVATGVFQVVWGGLFAALFGLSPGVLRLSTLCSRLWAALPPTGCAGSWR